MREIKFRAWYANQEMHYGIAPIDNKYYIFFETQKRNAHDLQINRAISIMQYTGLKDKNGREIYEGDIVQAEENIVISGKITNVKVNKVVKYEEGYAQFLLYTNKNKEHLTFATFGEVVGNIYENPELIEEGEE